MIKRNLASHFELYTNPSTNKNLSIIFILYGKYYEEVNLPISLYPYN